MNLVEELAAYRDKAHIAKLVRYVDTDPERVANLVQLTCSDQPGLAMRASWVLVELVMKKPQVIDHHITQLIQVLTQAAHPGVQRHVMKIFAERPRILSEDDEGELLQVSFELLQDQLLPVAIRVHAMQHIANLLPRYPELAGELRESIEAGWETGSAGFRNRGGKILKQMDKQYG